MDLREHLEHLRRLDDEDLLRSVKRHVGSECRLNALVLAHLAEIDARGAYRKWACDTLTTYCIYELRLSEDEAQRRCRAARVARQFPLVLEMLAEGSLHLTGILLLAPHLTSGNHRELLARARYRRKREIERLVAGLCLTSDVPSSIEPLGISAARTPRAGAKWAALVESQAGAVRHLQPGDDRTQAPSVPDAWHEDLLTRLEPPNDVQSSSTPDAPSNAPASTFAPAEVTASAPPARMPGDELALGAPLPNVSPPLRYKVQFTVDQAYVDLLERARDLLWHQLPNGDLAQLQRFALEALVEKLTRRKCGAPRPEGTAAARREGRGGHARGPGAAPAPAPRNTAIDAFRECAVPTRSDAKNEPPSKSAAPARSRAENEPPRERAAPKQNPSHGRELSRHIPAYVRREVWRRDEGRCTFVDERGVRCRATRALELHHEQPYARGGPSSVGNVTLRCRAHNELAAEHDFGRGLVLSLKQRRGAA